MPSTVNEIVYSVPSGRPNSVIQFTGAAIFVVMYGYYWTVGDAGSATWLLLMAAGCALSGIAESRPENRRRTVALFRLAALLVFLCVLAATVFYPEFVTG